MRGAYQFFRPAEDPIAQADLLLVAMRPDEPGDLPPVLDLEVNGGLTPARSPPRVKHVDRSRDRRDRPPADRLRRSLLVADLTGGADFTTSPLWIAQYTSARVPEHPEPVDEVDVLAGHRDGSVAGVANPGNLDIDVFDGTLCRPAAFANGGAAPCGTISRRRAARSTTATRASAPAARARTLRHVTDAGEDGDLYLDARDRRRRPRRTSRRGRSTSPRPAPTSVEAYTAARVREVEAGDLRGQRGRGHDRAPRSISPPPTAGSRSATSTFAAGGNQSIHLGDNTGEATPRWRSSCSMPCG